MFFRHTAVLWSFTDLLAGQIASPTFRQVNPSFDDGKQEMVCLVELSNSEPDGTVTCWLELGAEGIYLPTEQASPGNDLNGDPLPFTGLGPFPGAIPLLPGDDGGGGGGGPAPGFFTLAMPLVRVQVLVGDGALPNKASGRLILVSNGPIALRPVTP